MYKILDKCKCGAEFKVEGDNNDFCSKRHDVFIEAHSICRQMATTTKVVYYNEPEEECECEEGKCNCEEVSDHRT